MANTLFVVWVLLVQLSIMMVLLFMSWRQPCCRLDVEDPDESWPTREWKLGYAAGHRRGWDNGHHEACKLSFDPDYAVRMTPSGHMVFVKKKEET